MAPTKVLVWYPYCASKPETLSVAHIRVSIYARPYSIEGILGFYFWLKGVLTQYGWWGGSPTGVVLYEVGIEVCAEGVGFTALLGVDAGCPQGWILEEPD